MASRWVPPTGSPYSPHAVQIKRPAPRTTPLDGQDGADLTVCWRDACGEADNAGGQQQQDAMQPLGEQNLGSGHPGVGVTLNGRVPERERPLAERIAGAVAEAVAAGDQSRKDVFALFASADGRLSAHRQGARDHRGEAGADEAAGAACDSYDRGGGR
jgi:hypothetical protein